MKRVVFLLIVFFSIGGSSSVQGYPRDFNFILEYGVLNKNRLNTFDQTYKKDLVMDGEVTTKLILTKEEMEIIFKMMKRIDLFNYPEEIEGRVMLPASGYRFEIQYRGKLKTIHWRGEFHNMPRDNQFEELTKLILDTIESKESYKLLPP